jgi:hypothetical protein
MITYFSNVAALFIRSDNAVRRSFARMPLSYDVESDCSELAGFSDGITLELQKRDGPKAKALLSNAFPISPAIVVS